MAWVVNGVRLVEAHQNLYYAIKRLAKERGYCGAWNKQLAADWQVQKSADRVSHLLTDLRRAGLISLRIEYFDNSRCVKKRFIRIVADFFEAIAPIAPPIATNSEVHSVGCNNKNKQQQDEPTKKLMESARKLCISPYRVSIAIKKWGIKYVQEKIAIVANSRTVKNPVAYFLNALVADWKPNKRSSKKIGQVCDYTHIPTFTVNYENHEADAVIKTRSLSENSFLKDFIAKNPNAGLSKKFSSQLA